MSGMTPEPDLNDPAQVWVDRAITALKREFGHDDQVPRFVVVVEYPPEGRIGLASTGDDAVDVHRMLTLGAATVRHSMDEATKATAREVWLLMEAGFERRN